MDEMEIDYLIDFEKFNKASSEINYIKKLKIIQIIIPIFLIIFLTFDFCVEVWILGNPILEAVIWAYCVPIGIYIILSVLAHLVMRKISKKINVGFSKNQINRKLILNNEGINVDAVISKSILKWNFINRVVETKQLVIFYLTKFDCFWIPKTALDEEQIRKIHRILLNNLDCTKIEFISNDKSVIGKNK